MNIIRQLRERIAEQDRALRLMRFFVSLCALAGLILGFLAGTTFLHDAPQPTKYVYVSDAKVLCGCDRFESDQRVSPDLCADLGGIPYSCRMQQPDNLSAGAQLDRDFPAIFAQGCLNLARHGIAVSAEEDNVRVTEESQIVVSP